MPLATSASNFFAIALASTTLHEVLAGAVAMANVVQCANYRIMAVSACISE